MNICIYDIGDARNDEDISFSQIIQDISSDSDYAETPISNEYIDNVLEQSEDSPVRKKFSRTNEINSLKASEWLKNLKHGDDTALNPEPRQSSQLSINSETNSEKSLGNQIEIDLDDKPTTEIWDSSKKKKTKRGGLAEKWEEMIKNEISDRALKEHFKGKDCAVGMSFGMNSATLNAKIINYEKGLDQIIRFRCQKKENQAGQSNYRNFPSVTEIFELLLNKHETCDIDLSRGVKEIELKKPFVQVNICDYDENRKNEAITVITNPSFVNNDRNIISSIITLFFDWI